LIGGHYKHRLHVTIIGAVEKGAIMIKLKISGMKSRECAQIIRESLIEVDGVDEALVDFEKDEAIIEFEGHVPNDEALITAVKQAGYSAEIMIPSSKR
jgi:copper chaperone CopZ